MIPVLAAAALVALAPTQVPVPGPVRIDITAISWAAGIAECQRLLTAQTGTCSFRVLEGLHARAIGQVTR